MYLRGVVRAIHIHRCIQKAQKREKRIQNKIETPTEPKEKHGKEDSQLVSSSLALRSFRCLVAAGGRGGNGRAD